MSMVSSQDQACFLERLQQMRAMTKAVVSTVMEGMMARTLRAMVESGMRERPGAGRR